MLTVSEIIKTVDTDDQLFERVETCLNDFKNNFCRLGFMLRVLKERGYDNAYLMDRFGLSKSTINRSIQINEQFSENGYSYKLDEKYSDFKKSQLIEMLPLSQEQREEVSADMSVADIRDLKNAEDDDCDDDSDNFFEADEEQDDLPTFDVSDKMSAIRAAFAKKLSEMPEIGRDINKMISYISEVKDEDIHFIVENVDLYYSLTGSYLCLDSDEVDVVGYSYIFVHNFSSFSEVMEYSDYEYFGNISRYSVDSSLSKYLVDNFDDWDYVGADLKNVAKLLADNVPLEFELDDKYLVCIEGDYFVFKWLHYSDSKEFRFPRREFCRCVEDAFYNKLNDLFIKALSDNIGKCKHVYSSSDFSLYLCEANNRLEFIFKVDKDGNIDGFYGLAGRNFNGFPLDLIELSEFFSELDESSLRIFFLMCTGKDIQSAINAYK